MTISLNSNLTSPPSDLLHVFGFVSAGPRIVNARLFERTSARRVVRKSCIFCKSELGPLENGHASQLAEPKPSNQAEDLRIRRCSPLLERELLSDGHHLAPSEWKAVPDIWKSSAEKYGDQIALVDPYHDPPSALTYRQLEQEILYFAEGLRVAGVSPDEKIALFAENSCRWLIADQGIMATGAINVVRGARSSVAELFQIYNHSDSIALVVDNPDLFSRLAETFIPRAVIRFIILLWGEKSCLNCEVLQGIPIFSYTEIRDMGRDSRQGFLASSNEGNELNRVIKEPEKKICVVYELVSTGNRPH